MLDIKQLILDSTAKDRFENDAKWKDYQHTSWHASGCDSCLCGRYLQRLGAKPDKEYDLRTLNVFDVGKREEEWALDKIAKNPNILIEKQVRIEDKEFNVSGYADA